MKSFIIEPSIIITSLAIFLITTYVTFNPRILSALFSETLIHQQNHKLLPAATREYSIHRYGRTATVYQSLQFNNQ